MAERKTLRDFFEAVNVPYEGIGTDDAIEVVKSQPVAVLSSLLDEWGEVLLSAIYDGLTKEME